MFASDLRATDGSRLLLRLPQPTEQPIDDDSNDGASSTPICPMVDADTQWDSGMIGPTVLHGHGSSVTQIAREELSPALPPFAKSRKSNGCHCGISC